MRNIGLNHHLFLSPPLSFFFSLSLARALLPSVRLVAPGLRLAAGLLLSSIHTHTRTHTSLSGLDGGTPWLSCRLQPIPPLSLSVCACVCLSLPLSLAFLGAREAARGGRCLPCVRAAPAARLFSFAPRPTVCQGSPSPPPYPTSRAPALRAQSIALTPAPCTPLPARIRHRQALCTHEMPRDGRPAFPKCARRPSCCASRRRRAMSTPSLPAALRQSSPCGYACGGREGCRADATAVRAGPLAHLGGGRPGRPGCFAVAQAFSCPLTHPFPRPQVKEDGLRVFVEKAKGQNVVVMDLSMHKVSAGAGTAPAVGASLSSLSTPPPTVPHPHCRWRTSSRKTRMFSSWQDMTCAARASCTRCTALSVPAPSRSVVAPALFFSLLCASSADGRSTPAAMLTCRPVPLFAGQEALDGD